MRFPRFGRTLTDELAPNATVDAPALVRPSVAWREIQQAKAESEALATIGYLGFERDQLRYDCRVQALHRLVCESVVEYGEGTVHPEYTNNETSQLEQGE